MLREPTDTARPQSLLHAMAHAARDARPTLPRAVSKPAQQPAARHLLGSFGVIAGLLMFWAIAINL